MDITLLRELVTVLSFIAFMAIVAYALAPSNQERFRESARLPADEEGQ